MSIKHMWEIWQSPKEYVNCFIHPGLLPTGGLMVITGEPGVGKSFLAQQTAYELASGRRWLGLFPVRQSKTAYLEFEKRSPIARARFRREDWAKEYPETAKSLGYFDEDIPQLDTAIGTKRLESLANDFGARIIVVDSFATTVWDETDLTNLKKAIGNYRNLAKNLNLSFILIQHLIKRQTVYDHKLKQWSEPPLRLDDLRGSKFLEYEVDTVIGVAKKKNREREVGFLKHSFCPYPLSELPPLSFYWCPSTPRPFPPTNKADELLYLIDLGFTSFKQLTDMSNLSRPTIIKIIDELKNLGIVKKIEGGGKSKEAYVEPIIYH